MARSRDLSEFSRFRIPFALIVLSFWWTAVSRAQSRPEFGEFYYKQYLPETYGASPQNWATVEDDRGVMYFGNTDGILEYDGARWSIFKLPNGFGVRSLAVDESGTVFVGGQGELGYLKAGVNGTLAYTSLRDQIPEKDRRFSDVWTIFPTKSGVLFGSYQRIFLWSAARGMQVLRPSPKTRFGRLFVVDGVPYVVQRGIGLSRISQGRFELIPHGELFAHSQPGIIFSSRGELLVGTADTIYRQSGKSFVRWSNAASEMFSEFGIYTAVQLRNGNIAVGTVRGGLLILDPEGRLVRVINRKSGLASDEVNNLYLARDGSLWLALGRGIEHLEVELPLTRFADHEGLEEVVLAIARQQGTLYAGTMNGLARLNISWKGEPRFEALPGIQGQVMAFLPLADSLIVAGQRGIFEVRKGKVQTLQEGDLVNDLSASVQTPGRLYAAGRRALYILDYLSHKWQVVDQIPTEGPEFRTVLEDVDGRLWLTSGAGIWRLTLRPGQAPFTEQFTAKDGVPGPDDWRNNAYRIGTRIVFATPKGLLQFDHEKRRFVPCVAFGSMFADGSHAVSIIRQSPTGEVWMSGEGYHGILHPQASGTYRWDENPLTRSGIKEVYGLQLDQDNVAWASGADGGLVRYQVWSTSAPSTTFAAGLRGVVTQRRNRTLYGGIGSLPSAPEVEHQSNALSFFFSAPSFEDESRTQYQVRLDNLDHGWSEWNVETHRDYTNLYEGKYTFHVRARDLHGRISEEGTFAFSVLPPWYRTWWAYLLYGIACAAAITAIVKWRLHALAQANHRLEKIIQERTEEIRAQRDTIQDEEQRTEALLLNILPASVADELRSTGTVAPLAYEDITVCFTDFVGFTLSSEGLPPAALVASLHRYFTAFDEIIGRYGLEKLKTIGDSYMFVSGLPNRTKSHAVDAAMAALEIVEYVASQEGHRPGWKVRVGMHSGPVVAGVVGVRKFAFDIWGETVNFASRFESSGLPNQINLSVQTYELVRDFIDCEPRGLVSIKEGRKLEMYLARSIHLDLADRSGEEIPPKFAALYEERFGRVPRSCPLQKSANSLVVQASGD